MREPPIQLIPDSGRTFTSAGMAVFRESKAYLERILSSPPQSDKRDYEAMLAIRHEMIHFLHSFTTAYLYNHSIEMVRYGFNILDHFTEFLAWRNQRTPLERTISELESREYSVSVKDLFEGVAIVESYKMNTPEPDVGDFLTKLDEYFPGDSDSCYRRAFDYLSGKIGREFAYHLLAPLSFLALQFDNPPRYFRIIVEDTLPNRSLRQVVRASVPELYECFGMDAQGHILFALDNLPPNMRHPVLLECARYAVRVYGVSNLLEFAARPSLIESSNMGSEAVDALMPPLIVPSSSPGTKIEAHRFGVARNNKEVRELMVKMTGLIGAAERLTIHRDKTLVQFCPHRAHCHHYKSALCFNYFAPPSLELGYVNCGFIRDFESRTKIKPNEAWSKLNSA